MMGVVVEINRKMTTTEVLSSLEVLISAFKEINTLFDDMFKTQGAIYDGR
jgi:hypothetical protein